MLTDHERRNPPCRGCGGPHPFDTSIPSETWNVVVRAAGLPDYLCASCIIRAFAIAGVSFTANLWGETVSGRRLAVIVDDGDSLPPRASLVAKIAALRAWIGVAGHRDGCEIKDDGECSCGFFAMVHEGP